MKAREDRSGNAIGDGSINANYSVIDTAAYPQISVSVSESASTESVYVTYTLGDKRITCRFSWHENNAVKFGDQLNGYTATLNEVLYHLGLKSRQFVPNRVLSIAHSSVSPRKVGNYDRCDYTIYDLKKRGEGASLADVQGKLLKDANEVVTASVVSGYDSQWGDYEYFDNE